MAYDGTEGKTITRGAAQAYLTNYKSSDAYPANANKEGILFGKDLINSILQQTGCMGIRIYYGKEGTSNAAAPKMMLVGYDSNGNDMTSLVGDMGMPCPNYCSSAATHL